MARGIKRRLRKATNHLNKHMSRMAKDGGKYGVVAYEGYHAGYANAIQDIMLMLNGNEPCIHPEYYE